MIGVEFAGVLSKNLGSVLGGLEGTLKAQISQLQDLAIQKVRTQAEATLSAQIKLSTGVDISNNLSSIDPRNFNSSAKAAGTDLATSQAQSRGMEALNKFKSQSAQSKKVAALCKKIKKVLNQMQGPIDKLLAIIGKVTKIVILVKNILKALRILLKLAQLNPGSAALALKLEGLVEKAEKLLDSLSKVLVIAAEVINTLKGLLQVIKPLLGSLCKDDKTPLTVTPLSTTTLNTSTTPPPPLPVSPAEFIDNLINQMDNLIPKELIETEDSYKGYTFQVIEDKTQTSASGKVNKRYAIALNSQGIETFRSQASFATDKQILINELKFKIDNHLLNSSVQESV